MAIENVAKLPNDDKKRPESISARVQLSRANMNSTCVCQKGGYIQ